ncbi:hypothetical protein ACFX11_039328 [Malus domestica]
MEAEAHNKVTPVNLAHHTNWNIRGQSSGGILSHKIQIFGSRVTPVNDQLIPTGETVIVKGTPYEFLEPQEIVSKINGLLTDMTSTVCFTLRDFESQAFEEGSGVA